MLTDGEDNERVTTLDKVLSRFPLVDGEHIRGNLVILGDFELKTKLALPEGAFTITKSVTWSDISRPVVLWFPPNLRRATRCASWIARSIYGDYEWLIEQ